MNLKKKKKEKVLKKNTVSAVYKLWKQEEGERSCASGRTEKV